MPSLVKTRNAASDGVLSSISPASWPNCLAGVSKSLNAANNVTLWSQGIQQVFWEFDVPALVDTGGANFNKAELTIDAGASLPNRLTTDIYVFERDWGASVGTGDFRTGTQLAADYPNPQSHFSKFTYNHLDSGVIITKSYNNFATLVRGGVLRLILFSRHNWENNGGDGSTSFEGISINSGSSVKMTYSWADLSDNPMMGAAF